jgi:Domain of unknown function (DUF6089)
MKFASLLVLFFASVAVFGQATKYDKSKEIGLLGGTSYYLGEVNPYKHFGGNLHFAGGLSFRNNHSRRWTTKASLLYGTVEAWDKDNSDPWIQNRNLNFRNQFYEGSFQVELNFFNYQIGSENNISPYLFAGMAYYQMKPQGYYKGNWYELQPLGTEGEGAPGGKEQYKLGGLSMPLGVGLKFNLFAVFGFSLEWGLRKTWTDYFDDISGVYADPTLLLDKNGALAARISDQSLIKERLDPISGLYNNTGLQRGDSGRKDLYFFTMASINVRIDKKATSCWSGQVLLP